MRRIVEQLEADARVAAAWLAGSIGRGEDDVWSDLDLHVAVYDEHLTPFWADRYTLYERIGRPVLIQQEMASNAQAGGHFQLVVFDGPLEVDWNVGPLSLARRPPWHVLLFMREDVPLVAPPKLSQDERRAQCQERLVFIWTMAPIAVKYIARGDTSRAIGQIGGRTSSEDGPSRCMLRLSAVTSRTPRSRSGCGGAIETIIGKIARPKNVWIVPYMPKTSSEKIMRRVVVGISNFVSQGDITTLANPEIVATIRKHVQSARMAHGDLPRELSTQEREEIGRYGVE